MKSKLVSFWVSLSLILFVITFSIALPIYFRPFYYAQIKTLKMEETTPFTYSEIKEAYDECLNFCCFYTEFKTGKLVWSEEGKEHFADCRKLFTLDTVVLLVSSASLITIFILKKKKKIEFDNPYLLSGSLSIGIPLVIGFLAMLDFDRAFQIFHKIFFPGKSNWLFDPNTDEIILIMPEEFFMNCAILIGVSLLVLSISLIVYGIYKKKKTIKG